MPPEPLSGNRKEYLRKDRKHDLAEPVGPPKRWRDSPSSSCRWGFPSEFRRNSGHGKQGGWHMYPEHSGHGYPTAQTGDRFLDDNGCRPSMQRGEGRYGRLYRDSRSFFGQKEWKGHSWEANNHHNLKSSSRTHFMNDQRSFGGFPRRSSPMHGSHPLADLCDRFHSKDQVDKASHANSPRAEKENSEASLDWKPVKWSRSESLASRGSGFMQPSTSKSIGEPNDLKGDMPSKNASPCLSPSRNDAACEPPVVPMEETCSRKKPRLGWGEGLAKYEKKKVDGPEENLNKDSNAPCLSNVEYTPSLSLNLINKIPRAVDITDCSSPATPSSIACCSSPGLKGKACTRTTDADDCNVGLMPVSENQLEVLDLCLEKEELNLMTTLSYLLNELLQADDWYSIDSGLVKSSSLHKLLQWKNDVSKELELTETEIDLLENELNSLDFDSGSNNTCSTSLSLSSATCKDMSGVNMNMIQEQLARGVASSREILMEDMHGLPHNDVIETLAQNNVENICSSVFGMVKSKEKLAPQKTGSRDGISEPADPAESTRTVSKNLAAHTYVENGKIASCPDDDRRVIHLDNNQAIFDTKEDNLYDNIFACNKESATRAAEVLFKSVPHGHVDSPAHRTPCLAAKSTIRGKILRRKQSLRLKEKVVALKYRGFQHLWKEDLCLFSVKGHGAKLLKNSDLGPQTMRSMNQKHRSSIRSHFSSPVESLSLVPTTETISSVGKLLSNSQVKTYRKNLKMPAMVLDEKDRKLRFVSTNALVEDPHAIEEERTLINPWTAEEKAIFLDKLAIHGKDFSKIASFLEQKTTADCIEFYYKNHKSKCFEKIQKQLVIKKQEKPLPANTYLLTSERKWGREINAASLDILGEASVIATLANETLEPPKLLSGKSHFKSSKISDAIIVASTNYQNAEDGKESLATDVLASICEHPLTPNATENIDDGTYSDESCEEMDPLDWTDDEKFLFVQAFSSFGKDFMMISQSVGTKSRDQCKVFFSKAHKCLGLDNLRSSTSAGAIDSRNDTDGGSATEDACTVETCSGEKAGCQTDEDLQSMNQDVSKLEAMVTESCRLVDNCGTTPLDHKDHQAAALGRVMFRISNQLQLKTSQQVPIYR